MSKTEVIIIEIIKIWKMLIGYYTDDLGSMAD